MLEKGHIVEDGTPSRLLRADVAYRRMMELWLTDTGRILPIAPSGAEIRLVEAGPVPIR